MSNFAWLFDNEILKVIQKLSNGLKNILSIKFKDLKLIGSITYKKLQQRMDRKVWSGKRRMSTGQNFKKIQLSSFGNIEKMTGHALGKRLTRFVQDGAIEPV